MNCNDNNLSKMLSDYWSGHLSAEEKQKVEGHITSCAKCRSDLKLMNYLARRASAHSDEETAAHLDPDLIAKYYENSKGLDSQTKHIVKQHLEVCNECAYELHFLSSLEDDLTRSLPTQMSQSSVLQNLFSWLFGVVRRPAFSYILLLITIYPAARWIMETSSDSTRDGSRLLLGTLYDLKEVTRTAGDIPIIVRSQSSSLVMLEVPFYHLENKYGYLFAVSDRDQTTQFDAQVISSFDKEGSIILILQTSSLPDGEFMIQVSEFDRNDNADRTARYFPFELRTD